MRRAMRVVFTLGLAFATGGSFGESTEGTSTRFGVGAVGILGIAGGRMCGKSRTRIFPRTEVITFFFPGYYVLGSQGCLTDLR